MTTPNPTAIFNQYSNAKIFFSTSVPNWIGANKEDQDRVRAYMFYERLYWNVPDTLAIVERGEDSLPIYLPSARKMVEACNRFLCVDWDYSITSTAGSASDQAQCKVLMDGLFKNQKMKAKFARQKRYGLIRGDAVWHVRADANRPAGSRIDIYEVDPTNAFPILEDLNPDRIIGWHLIDLVPDPRDVTKQVVRRQTYTKATGDYFGPSIIMSSIGYYELGKWDDRKTATNANPEVAMVPWEGEILPFELPTDITYLPVYLIPNQKQPCQTFGSSEVRGIETVIASVNQSVSDQDLTLAMQGLGVYTSTAGPPVAADGTAGTFDIGPGRVVEVPADATFSRVSGVGASLPGIEHMNFILGETQSAVGIPDIAAGIVDVSVAESGIALQLQLSPLLSHNKEKETDMMDEYNCMFRDLVEGWFPAYEGFGSNTGVEVTMITGNPVPQDRAARFKEIVELVQAVPPLMSTRTAIDELNKIGYDMPKDELDQLTQEAQARAQTMQLDPFAQRALGEFAAPVNSAGNAVPPSTLPVAPPKPINGLSGGAGAAGGPKPATGH